MQTSFDFESAQRAKEVGMYVAAEGKQALLEHARKLAAQIAKRQGTVNADDVALALECEGISVFALGNAAGSLFAGKRFEWTGERIRSARVHSHGNEIKVWKLREN